MKQKFLNYSLYLLKKYYPNESQEFIEEYEYKIHALYLSLSKMFIIIPLTILLNIFFESLIILITFNFLRHYAHGIHAKKSIYCLLVSINIFVILPFIIKYIELNTLCKIICLVFSIINICIYAPADTEKAPMVNTKKRKKYKIISIINYITLSVIVLINDNNISNLVLVTMLLVSILIHPLIYYFFKENYNNYKQYY